MPELRMPSLGADMDHGKIVEWLVNPGDPVHRGDLVAVVDTDKTIMDVESFEDGVIEELLVGLGETVPVGTAIARLAGVAAPAGAPHEERTTAAPPQAVLPEPVRFEPAPSEPAPPQPVLPQTALPQPAASRVRSSPLARRLAVQLGLDLASIQGTGQQGSVTEADVRHAAAAQAAGPPRAATAPGPPRQREGAKSATLRSSIAALMAKSKTTIPHYYLSTTLDLSTAIARMQELNASRPLSARLVPAAFLLKAAAVAAREVPDVNGFYADGAFQPSKAVHLGVAVALRGGGLVAPALHDADTLTVDDLMAKLRDLVARARAGRVQRAEMADPTITVTSLGDLGVETVFGVIVPPQVAMVGLGRVVERPWAHDGMIGVRPTATATLSGDHRVSDGLGGGRYLVRLQELLMKPEEL